MLFRIKRSFTFLIIVICTILCLFSVADLTIYFIKSLFNEISSNHQGDIQLIEQTPNTLTVKVTSSGKYYYIVSKISGLVVIEIPYSDH